MSAEPRLHAVATAVRTFLEPVWRTWHAAQGRVAEPPSRATCGRSSLFLERVLREQCGLDGRLRHGTPRLGPDMPEIGPFGFFAGERWEAHAWVEVGGWIVDVTADQFGAPPVLVTAVGDTRYGIGPADTALPAAQEARRRTVDLIWPDWLARNAGTWPAHLASDGAA